MKFTEPFWIEGPWQGRVAISARPRGGDWLDDELNGWRNAGVDAVVSLLEPHEAADLDLTNERKGCEVNGMRFYSLPIVDRSIPKSAADVVDLLHQIEKELANGENVLIHCRQGVGRAGLMACALLIEVGANPAKAIDRVSAARGVAVPETSEQRAWVDSFAAELARKS